MSNVPRPPLADERLHLRADGRVLLELKTPWHDGTTHLDLDPLDFLARCAALIPRPHKNLVVYHGVLSAHARLRTRAVEYGRPELATPPLRPCSRDADSQPATLAADAPRASARRGAFADLKHRAFGYDLLSCLRCGAKMTLLASILERATIARILTHRGLPTEIPALAPARASPQPDPGATTSPDSLPAPRGFLVPPHRRAVAHRPGPCSAALATLHPLALRPARAARGATFAEGVIGQHR